MHLILAKELQDVADVDIIAFNASITAMARSSQWQHALLLSPHLPNLNYPHKSYPPPETVVYMIRPYYGIMLSNNILIRHCSG